VREPGRGGFGELEKRGCEIQWVLFGF